MKRHHARPIVLSPYCVFRSAAGRLSGGCFAFTSACQHSFVPGSKARASTAVHSRDRLPALAVGRSALPEPIAGHPPVPSCSSQQVCPPHALWPISGVCAARSAAAIRLPMKSPCAQSALKAQPTGRPIVRVGAVPQSGWQCCARPVDQMQLRSPGPSFNGVISCRVASRRQRRSRIGGADRTLRYPPDRCLACQQPVGTDAAVQEATLTMYEPRAVLTIRFRVRQPCALNLDPHADAPQVTEPPGHLVHRRAPAAAESRVTTTSVDESISVTVSEPPVHVDRRRATHHASPLDRRVSRLRQHTRRHRSFGCRGHR